MTLAGKTSTISQEALSVRRHVARRHNREISEKHRDVRCLLSDVRCNIIQTLGISEDIKNEVLSDVSSSRTSEATSRTRRPTSHGKDVRSHLKTDVRCFLNDVEE